jgi:hypothetical protein
MTGPHKPLLQTEFEFSLPKGHLDAEGNLHRTGTMRLSTALDEIAPLRDPRVKSNQAYLSVVVLSRVITRLGTLTDINTTLVESLFTADLAYLQDFYRKINSEGESSTLTVTCPACEHVFDVENSGPGGS